MELNSSMAALTFTVKRSMAASNSVEVDDSAGGEALLLSFGFGLAIRADCDAH